MGLISLQATMTVFGGWLFKMTRGRTPRSDLKNTLGTLGWAGRYIRVRAEEGVKIQREDCVHLFASPS